MWQPKSAALRHADWEIQDLRRMWEKLEANFTTTSLDRNQSTRQTAISRTCQRKLTASQGWLCSVELVTPCLITIVRYWLLIKGLLALIFPKGFSEFQSWKLHYLIQNSREQLTFFLGKLKALNKCKTFVAVFVINSSVEGITLKKQHITSS
jgi:hypothetical protein